MVTYLNICIVEDKYIVRKYRRFVDVKINGRNDICMYICGYFLRLDEYTRGY